METKLSLRLVLYLLILGIARSQKVQEMSHTERASSLLQQAITYLVNYTAAEAKAHMDAYNLASRVAAIAYDKLTDKLGMWNM